MAGGRRSWAGGAPTGAVMDRPIPRIKRQGLPKVSLRLRAVAACGVAVSRTRSPDLQQMMSFRLRSEGVPHGRGAELAVAINRVSRANVPLQSSDPCSPGVARSRGPSEAENPVRAVGRAAAEPALPQRVRPRPKRSPAGSEWCSARSWTAPSCHNVSLRHRIANSEIATTPLAIWA